MRRALLGRFVRAEPASAGPPLPALLLALLLLLLLLLAPDVEGCCPSLALGVVGSRGGALSGSEVSSSASACKGGKRHC